MDKKQKQEVISKFGKNEKDTGNTEVQIAILSTRISELTQHLRTHKKDHHTRRGLLEMVSQRRKLLKYLSKKNHERYLSLTDELSIRR